MAKEQRREVAFGFNGENPIFGLVDEGVFSNVIIVSDVSTACWPSQVQVVKTLSLQ